jgi:anti-anti-sigma regulatory factor
MKRFRDWLYAMRLEDPVQIEQAALYQVAALILIGGAVAWLPISLTAFTHPIARALALASSLAVWAGSGSAIMCLRRGMFHLSIGLLTSGIFAAVSLILIATGVRLNGALLFVYALPLVLVGLAWGRSGLLLFGGLCFAIVISLAVMEYSSPQLIGFGTLDEPISIVGTFGLALVLLCLFLDQFGGVFRRALAAAGIREQELLEVQGSLETIVAQRTAALTEAIQASEQREEELTRTLGALQTSQATIRELSAPVIPVLANVLIMPLVGTIDRGRVATITDNLLRVVERRSARYVILDITGVPLVDDQVAQLLMHTTVAVGLLGAKVLLVGIRPEVAETLVGLDVNLDSVIAYGSLQDAVMALLASDSQPSMGGGR